MAAGPVACSSRALCLDGEGTPGSDSGLMSSLHGGSHMGPPALLSGLLPFIPNFTPNPSPRPQPNQSLQSMMAKMLSRVIGIESNQHVMLSRISNIETTQQLLLQTLGLTLALQQQSPGQAQAQAQVLGQFLMQAAQQQQQQQHQQQQHLTPGQGNRGAAGGPGFHQDSLNQLHMIQAAVGVDGLGMSSDQAAAAESVEHVVAAAMHELQQQVGNKHAQPEDQDMLADMVADHGNKHALPEDQDMLADLDSQQQQQQQEHTQEAAPHGLWAFTAELYQLYTCLVKESADSFAPAPAL
eukprot:gene10269-8190_t